MLLISILPNRFLHSNTKLIFGVSTRKSICAEAPDTLSIYKSCSTTISIPLFFSSNRILFSPIIPAFTTAISFAIFFAFSPAAFSASSSSCRRYSFALLDSFAITTSGFENSPMFIPRVSLFPAIFACIILVYHIGETRKSSVLKFIHRFVHIFVDISAGTQKPQTKVCGFCAYLALPISVAFLSTICAVYVYDADCSGNHTRVLFCVVCDSGVNILLHLCHALLAGDAAEYRFTDDFSVPVDNIGGRE